MGLYDDPLNPNMAPQIAQGLANPPAAPSLLPPSQAMPQQDPTPMPPTPAAAMPQAALPPQPAGPTTYDPYSYVAPNSALNQPQVQDKLTQAFMRMAESATSGHDRAAEKQQAATKIFGGAAAALGGVMGGGYAAGGLQALQMANQAVQDAKGQRHQDQQQSLTGMQTLANILRNTSKDTQNALAGQVRLAIQGQRAQTYAEHTKTKDANETKKVKETERHHQLSESLRAIGITNTHDVALKKLEQVKEHYAEEAALRRQLAQLKAESQKYGDDKRYQGQIESINTRIKLSNQARQAAALKFDDEMEARLGRRDSNGNLVYQGVAVPSLANTVQDVDLMEAPPAAQAPAPLPAQAPAAAAPQAAAPQVSPNQQKALGLMTQYQQLFQSGHMPPEIYQQKLQSFQRNFPMFQGQFNGQ